MFPYCFFIGGVGAISSASSSLESHDVTGGEYVQVIGIPLHHGRALGQVLGFVVDTGNPVFDVR